MTKHTFTVRDKIDRSGPLYKKKSLAQRGFSVSVAEQVTVGRFQLNSDGTPAGDAAVQAMAAVAEQDYQTLKGIYGLGDIPGQPIIVHVDTTAGGAYHLSCAGTEIWLIPEDAPSLLVAELDECFQALQGKMDCGLGVGEGHSRAMAMVVRPFKVLTGLDGDVQGWWNGGSPTDYFSDGTQSDQDQLSNACNTLGWFWLNSLGYDWPTATKFAGMKLSDVYASLTGKLSSQGFTDFVAALNAIPQPWADDPFTSAPTPAPTPNPVPTPVPTPTPTPSSGISTAVVIALALVVAAVLIFLVLHH
jgi:hypothetical protein